MSPLAKLLEPNRADLTVLEDLFDKIGTAINPVSFLYQLGSVDTEKIGSVGYVQRGSTNRNVLDGEPIGVTADLNQWRGTLKAHWDSPAVRGADRQLLLANANIHLEVGHMSDISNELQHLASTLEVGFLDIASVLLATAGIIVSVPGLELAVVSVLLGAISAPFIPEGIGAVGEVVAIAGVVVAAVALVVSVLAYFLAFYAAIKPRLDALHEAGSIFAAVIKEQGVHD